MKHPKERPKAHRADCDTCEERAAKIDVFSRAIRLEGDLSEEQRARLLGIADKCPVHRTLENAARIETRLE